MYNYYIMESEQQIKPLDLLATIGFKGAIFIRPHHRWTDSPLRQRASNIPNRKPNYCETYHLTLTKLLAWP